MQEKTQSVYSQEDEDEVITQIKALASEIFTSFSDNEGSRADFQADLQFSNKLRSSPNRVHTENNYSMTQRCHRHQYESLADEWIGEQNHEDLGPILYGDQMERMDGQQVYRSAMCEPLYMRPTENFKKKIIEKKKGTQGSKYKFVNGNQIRALPPLQASSPLLQPIRNFKQSTIQQIEEKNEEEIEEQRKRKRKRGMKSLNQLYEQKQPLYERFLREKDIKRMKLSLSRIAEEEKEMEGYIGAPEVNHNVEVKGSFEERLENKKKQKQFNQQKIVYEVMESSPFVPQTSSPKRYEGVQSKVKQIWKQENSGKGSSSGEGGDGNDLKGISHSLLRTGSFFSDESQQIPSKNKSFELKLKNVHQLSNILEMDDMNEE